MKSKIAASVTNLQESEHIIHKSVKKIKSFASELHKNLNGVSVWGVGQNFYDGQTSYTIRLRISLLIYNRAKLSQIILSPCLCLIFAECVINT